jgi:hypothetical protein
MMLGDGRGFWQIWPVRIRRLTLYPIELRAQTILNSNLIRQKLGESFDL